MSIFQNNRNQSSAPSIPMDKLMRFTNEVEDIAQDGVVCAEDIDDLSADLGIPRDRLYAGLGASDAATIKREHEIQIAVCTGGCQRYGALQCLSKLLDLREARIENKQLSFDVIPRHCLNRCQDAAIIEIRSPDGTAVLAKATPDAIIEAIDQLFD